MNFGVNVLHANLMKHGYQENTSKLHHYFPKKFKCFYECSLLILDVMLGTRILLE